MSTVSTTSRAGAPARASRSTDDGTLSPAARSVVRGSILGFFVVGGLTGAAALAFGAGAAGAAAIAAFTGVWGGPGFGGMMAYVLHESKTSRRQPVAAPADPLG
jgi:hypothetical protein